MEEEIKEYYCNKCKTSFEDYLEMDNCPQCESEDIQLI